MNWLHKSVDHKTLCLSFLPAHYWGFLSGMSSFIIYTECVNLPIVQGIVCDFAVTQIKVAQFIKQLSHFTNIAPGASFILNSSCRRPFEKHRSSAIAFARRVVGSSFFMVIASPSDVFYLHTAPYRGQFGYRKLLYVKATF